MTYLHSHTSPSSPILQPVQYRWPEPRYPEARGLPAGEGGSGTSTPFDRIAHLCHTLQGLCGSFAKFRQVHALALASISVKLQALGHSGPVNTLVCILDKAHWGVLVVVLALMRL